MIFDQGIRPHLTEIEIYLGLSNRPVQDCAIQVDRKSTEDRLNPNSLASLTWRDPIARPANQFQAMWHEEMLDQGFDWSNALESMLDGQKNTAYSLVSNVVAAIALIPLYRGTIFIQGPLINSHAALTIKSIPQLSKDRVKEVKLPSLENAERVIGWVLLQQHYFALVILPGTKQIQVANSLTYSDAILKKIKTASQPS